jgi:HSP20 family protein
MSALQRSRAIVPETVLDWFESPLTSLRPYLAQAIRVEEYAEDNKYIVRAELAGVDPERDIEITAGNGYLSIHAERSGRTEGKHRSEFRYGSFSRTISLPPNVDEDNISASYDKGILTVTVPFTRGEEGGTRRIPISQAGGPPQT